MLTPGLLSRTIEYNGLDFRRDGLRLQIARTPYSRQSYFRP